MFQLNIVFTNPVYICLEQQYNQPQKTEGKENSVNRHTCARDPADPIIYCFMWFLRLLLALRFRCTFGLYAKQLYIGELYRFERISNRLFIKKLTQSSIHCVE